MITAEAIAVAMESGDRRMAGATCGWFTNGHFAIKGYVELATDVSEEMAAKIDAAIGRWQHEIKTIPVLEAVELRIAQTTRIEACDSCDGEPTLHSCECGHEHVCKKCDGQGTFDVLDDYGQFVFQGGGGSTVADPRLGALLEGLTVCRDASPGEEPGTAMLLGYDNGELVVAVMPLREKVRDPKAATP